MTEPRLFKKNLQPRLLAVELEGLDVECEYLLLPVFVKVSE